MVTKLTLFLACCSFITFAQTEKGIEFVQGLSWQQVLEKAKAEKKYVFVDAYATWCAPCKMMDKDVYASEKVGEYINRKFISVKVQMDTTSNDNEQVKQWYADASRIFKAYQITAFPTYLFFSPEGKIVHRGVGAKTVTDFISLARDASDADKQYYTQLEKYDKNELDYLDLPNLANMTLQMGKQELAYKMAKTYKKEHLDKLGIDQLKHEDLAFLNQFYKLIIDEGSKGSFFGLFYHHPDKMDEIASWKGFSLHYVNTIITKEEIDSKLWKDGKAVTKNPDWKKISDNIRKKYNDSYAEALVMEAKLNFYRRMEDWRLYAELRDEKIRKYPPNSEVDAWALNGVAWDVFLYCTDKSVLDRALKWIDLSLVISGSNPNDQCLDTKASLLYKLGRVDEAIEWEKKAVGLLEERLKKNGTDPEPYTKEYREVIKKMRSGEPIYKSQGAVWPAR